MKPTFNRPPSTMSAAELATTAVDDYRAIKMVLSEFDRRTDAEPDREAAAVVIGAYAKGGPDRRGGARPGGRIAAALRARSAR